MISLVPCPRRFRFHQSVWQRASQGQPPERTRYERTSKSKPPTKFTTTDGFSHVSSEKCAPVRVSCRPLWPWEGLETRRQGEVREFVFFFFFSLKPCSELCFRTRWQTSLSKWLPWYQWRSSTCHQLLFFAFRSLQRLHKCFLTLK